MLRCVVMMALRKYVYVVKRIDTQAIFQINVSTIGVGQGYTLNDHDLSAMNGREVGVIVGPFDMDTSAFTNCMMHVPYPDAPYPDASKGHESPVVVCSIMRHPRGRQLPIV